ncbi:hypothetical protein SJA_C2-00040 [Sphingobium indicum UT26S]|uniref:Uncharacterized protein n=1 Tax=Sphingobium indicum (strain DSM 16413 / CCM 7287 / MTCC 6362 / UT26 / NBRC 101211 / UT26S) TaxID=452662 RepID=D4Z798_SPHIU|nr:hypothetical protein SJA_C2-00040 [Sphingobium indicum UT26S]
MAHSGHRPSVLMGDGFCYTSLTDFSLLASLSSGPFMDEDLRLLEFNLIRFMTRQLGQIRKCREMAMSGHYPHRHPGLDPGSRFCLYTAPSPRQRDPGSSPG